MFLTSAFVSIENTRTVATNLGCRNQYDGNTSAKRVDVLIPNVIQVYSISIYKMLD